MFWRAKLDSRWGGEPCPCAWHKPALNGLGLVGFSLILTLSLYCRQELPFTAPRWVLELRAVAERGHLGAITLGFGAARELAAWKAEGTAWFWQHLFCYYSLVPMCALV